MLKNKTTATWHIDLMIECPHCGHAFDAVSENPEMWTGVKPLECREDFELTCPKCDETFEADLNY